MNRFQCKLLRIIFWVKLLNSLALSKHNILLAKLLIELILNSFGFTFVHQYICNMLGKKYLQSIYRQLYYPSSTTSNYQLIRKQVLSGNELILSTTLYVFNTIYALIILLQPVTIIVLMKMLP